VELSNGTKFLCFINDYCGPDDDLLSERGKQLIATPHVLTTKR